MLKMAVGQTEELDGEFAADEILKQCAEALAGDEPQAGLLLAAHDLDIEDFLAAIAEAYPELDLIGCTTLGPMSSVSAYSEGSTTLTLFASDVLDFTTGLGTNVSAGVADAARQAVESAAGRTDKDPALLIVTPSVEGLDPSLVIREVAEVLGPDVPLFGGGAAPDFPMTAPWLGAVQYYGDQVLTDSLPVLLVSGPLTVSVGVAHGWNPVGRKAVVTRSEDYTVYEIDGEPAVANPLAILDQDTGKYYLRAPLEYDAEDGSATFFGSVPQGSTVQLAMASIDQILNGTEVSVAHAVAGFPEETMPEGALIVSCAVRNFLLGTRTGGEIERIRAGLG
jgi:hypothetical protein